MRLLPIAAALLLVAACSRDAAEPVTAPPSVAPTAVAPTAAAPAPAAPAAAPADPSDAFDVGAFAGTFLREGERLELHADGSYGLQTPQGASAGTWTHEDGAIRLDPADKNAPDRVIRMTGRDTLASDGDTPLTRQPAP